MTDKDVKQELRALGYTDEVIESGVNKAKRWMKAAYGEVDWEELENETGNALGSVIAYCEETLAVPDGIKTFNRSNK